MVGGCVWIMLFVFGVDVAVRNVEDFWNREFEELSAKQVRILFAVFGCAGGR